MAVRLPCGMELRPASAEDMAYAIGCIGADVIESVDSDEKEIAPLWIESVTKVAAESISKRAMGDEVLILSDGGENAGMLWLGVSADQFTSEPTGYVLGIRVEPGYRDRGVGGEMLAWAESRFREMGLTSVTLNVGSANADAVRFYERCGYVPRSIVMRKRI